MSTPPVPARIYPAPPLSPSTTHAAGEELAAHNLPAPITRFVGRQKELRLLQSLLPHDRFITIVGPGGAGKTRLAVQAGWQVLANFRDGVWLVPLMAVASPDMFLFAISEALQLPAYSGLEPQKQIVNFLRGKRLLLILDNFEQLIPAANLLPNLLQQAPDVTALVTSRQRLNLYGECVFDLSGLGLPIADTLEALEASSAGQLFVQNAHRARPDFSLTHENYTAVIRICQLVEGMPLALELAGAWARAMSCKQIAAQIEQDLDFLVAGWQDQPERRRSMRAMLEHSWEMLVSGEQRALRKLSVIAGSFDLLAAQSVAQVNLAELATLVDKSLLHWDAAGERYESHPLLKRFAAERLAENAAEQAESGESHSRHFLDFVGQRQQTLRSRQLSRALHEIGEAISDVRQAWSWAVQHSHSKLIDASLEGIYRFYETRGWFQDGETALSSAILAFDGDTPLVARLQARRGILYNRLGKMDAARRDLSESVAALRAADQPGEAAFARFHLANLALGLGEFDEAQAGLLEALEMARACGQRSVEADSLGGLANLDILQGRFDTAGSYNAEALKIRQEIGDRRGEASELHGYGMLYLRKGEYDQSVAAGRAALEIFREIGHLTGEARSLDVIGWAYLYLGRYAEARRYQDQALAIKRKIGDRLQEGPSANNLGFTEMLLGNFEPAEEYFGKALEIARELNRRPAQSTILSNLALLRSWQSDPERGRAYAEQALQIAQETGGRQEQATAFTVLGHLSMALQQFEAAVQAYQQSYDLHREMNVAAGMLEAQAGLAQAALALGNLPQAQQHAEPIWQAIQSRLPDGADQPFHLYLVCYQVFCAARRPLLSDEVLRTACRFLHERAGRISDEGLRHLYLENVPAHRELLRHLATLDDAEAAKVATPPKVPQPLPDPLTRQEVEVLHLLAEGLTNQQIAEKLVITVGTAKFHVHNVYIKLGAQNRTQAVARGRELGLV